MTDRLTLTRALEGAGIESAAAARIATAIMRVIDRGVEAAPENLSSHQGRIAKAFENGGLQRKASEQIAMVIVDLIRQRHPELACGFAVDAVRDQAPPRHTATIHPFRRIICAVALAVAFPALAAEPFDWDRYHERQDACREVDRIAAQRTQGYCDEPALRQAKRACSPFTGERR